MCPASEACISTLKIIAARNLPLVVHPDVIQNYCHWTGFGNLLYIENMDKRKAVGRTAGELAALFSELPEASLCFDIGHARQVDPTMSHAVEMLRAFTPRLRQLHVSQVNSQSKHVALDLAAVRAFRQIAQRIPQNIPVVIESPMEPDDVRSEIAAAQEALAVAQKSVQVAPS